MVVYSRLYKMGKREKIKTNFCISTAVIKNNSVATDGSGHYTLNSFVKQFYPREEQQNLRNIIHCQKGHIPYFSPQLHS